MRNSNRDVRDLLTRVGERCSPTTIHKLNRIVDYMEVGRWVHARGFVVPQRFSTRTELFDSVAEGLAHRQVLYLEFGVAAGDCTRYWAALLHNPDTHLHGFDSFVGLPSNWKPDRPQGFFSTGGAIPEINDERVRFYVGLFEETLPTYEAPEHDCLVAILDADLYSSTAYALNCITPLLCPGSYIYFDEFNDRSHELRAFDEFLGTTGMTFRIIGATLGLSGVFFQRIA